MKILLIIIFLILLYLIYKNLSILYLFIANKKYTDNNIEESLLWYEKAYKFKHSSPHIKIIYAYILLRQGNIDKSEEILRIIIKQPLSERDKIDTSLNLSLVLWKKGDLDGAIQLLKELYNADLRNTLLYQNLGYYLILKGDYEEALKFNLEACEYNGDDPSLLDNLGMCYYYMKDYEKALDIYNKLMPKNPTFVTAYYYYAKTLIAQGKYEKALESLRQALNCRFSFISTIQKEEVETEIKNVEQLVNSSVESSM